MKSIEELQKEKLQAEINKINEESAQIKRSELNTNSDLKRLEEEKLNAEIKKIQEETLQLNKPFIKQGSFWGLIVSVFIPIMTIVLTYFFGGGKAYFDAQTNLIAAGNKNLEYDKKVLSAQVASLHQDSARLFENHYKDSVFLFEKHYKDSLSLEKDKSEIKKQIENNTSKLASVTAALARKEEEVAKSSFYLLWKRLLLDPDYLMNARPLIDTINGSKYRSKYISTLELSCDTTRSFALKGILQFTLYALTKEEKWRTGFIKTATDICDEINKKEDSNPGKYTQFWYAFQWLPYDQTENKKIEIAQLLLTSIKSIHNNNTDQVNAILDVLSSIIRYDDTLLSYLQKKENICFLIEITRKTVLTKTVYGLRVSSISILERLAPIAYSCLVSDIFSDPELSKDLGDYYKTDLTGKARIIIENNKDVFSQPKFLLSNDDWKTWQAGNIGIVDAFNNISAENCNDQQVISLIGKGLK